MQLSDMYQKMDTYSRFSRTRKAHSQTFIPEQKD